MNIIHTLPPHVADLIAAGEVVERPASVVKELIENSVDAGASAVTVEIQRGGMSYIRVSDNGKGMSPDDAAVAFLRHATSKLKDEYGLEAIGTLGFRGEALAAVSSVSRIQLITREKGAQEGCALSLEAGELLSHEPAGCPEGTTMIVRDLFFNTPARLKFMKKDSAEAAAVTTAVLRCALSRPELSVRYIKDGEEQFQTPGDGKALSSVYATLGRDFASSLLPVGGSGEGIRIDGFVSTPFGAKGSRTNQYFFVNGRHIKSTLIQAALEQAYKGSLFTGRYPACVLYLSVKLSAVDVNVHPAKTELRFLQEKQVFDAVYRTVLASLGAEHSGAPMELEVGRAEEKPKVQPTVSAVVEKPVQYAAAAKRKAEDVPSPVQMRDIVEQLVFKQSAGRYNAPAGDDDMAEPQAIIHSPEPVAETYVPAAQPETEELQPPQYRLIGEAFNEFIIVECGGELVLIDKHAAHERMIFDKLKENNFQSMSQQLLEPLHISPGAEDAQLLCDNQELLCSAGIEIEDFGGGTLLLRRLPEGVDAGAAETMLSEAAEAIRTGRKPASLGVKDELLASVACKAAVKAGKGSEPDEWIPVAEAVLSDRVKYCPHGRPVAMRISKRQLDKNFKRTT